MNRLKKILMAIFMIGGTTDASAMEKQPEFGVKLEQGQTGHNNCCHWCRQSLNRPRKTIIPYWGCRTCKMIFCGRKACAGGTSPFSQEGCWVCKGQCCCSSKQKCPKQHSHCFTHNRTVKPHAGNLNSAKVSGPKRKIDEPLGLKGKEEAKRQKIYHIPEYIFYPWYQTQVPFCEKPVALGDSDEDTEDSVEDIERLEREAALALIILSPDYK